MEMHEREDRLRLMTALLTSSEWELLQREYLTQVKNLKNKIDVMLESADQNDRSILVQQGIKMGIEWCLARPDHVRKDNETFLSHVRNLIFK